VIQQLGPGSGVHGPDDVMDGVIPPMPLQRSIANASDAPYRATKLGTASLFPEQKPAAGLIPEMLARQLDREGRVD
jgi:hypothetical protein